MKFTDQVRAEVATRRLLSFGLGSFATAVLWFLLRWGVARRLPGNIRVIDPETVTKSNVQKYTVFRYRDIGKSKVQAVGDLIRDHFQTEREEDSNVPLLRGHQSSITRQNLDWAVELASLCDLALVAFDEFDLALELGERLREVCPSCMAIVGPRAGFSLAAFTVPDSNTPPLRDPFSRLSSEGVAGADVGPTGILTHAIPVVELCLSILSSTHRKHFPIYQNASVLMTGVGKESLVKLPPDQLRTTLLFGSTRKDSDVKDKVSIRK